MSSFVKCFDVVSMVVEEATARLSPLLKRNEERYRILQQYCDVIDLLAKEYNAEAFEVGVDEEDTTVSIKMECGEMAIDSQNSNYYKLVSRSVSFGFSYADNGNVIVEFVFPSLWENRFGNAEEDTHE